MIIDMENEKELLKQKWNADEVLEADLSFGRKMPFGKYKGQYVYWLLIKHWRYMTWIVKNTGFQLTETEQWWRQKVLDYIHDFQVNQWIADLCGYMSPDEDCGNIENPHWIVE